jgi:hypothetical protein
VNFGSWFNAVRLRMNPLLGLARGMSWRVWLGAACLVLAGFWLHEHDVQVRRNALLQQAQRAAAAEVSSLKKQVAAEVHAANVENARALEKLQARRQEIDRRDQELTARLAALRQEAPAQAQRVAALPTSEVVTRVAAQLGFHAQDLVPGASLPGEDAAPAGETNAAPEASKGSSGAGSPEISVLPLSASGARKVETALVELAGCRAQSSLQEQLITNCRARAATDAATIQRQAGSIAMLNQARAAQEQINQRQQAACREELRAARGTFLSRLARVSKHVAIGVAVGVVIGVAVR